MKKSMLFAVMLVLIIGVSGQNPYLELKYKAVDNATHMQLDSIKIMNLTQNCDTVLYSPDTLLLLGSDFGTNEYIGSGSALLVFQNFPNPVLNKTTIPMYIPERDEVRIIITDVLGRVIVKKEMELDKGMHSFRFAPGTTGFLFFTIKWRGETNSIRILSTISETKKANSVEYIGNETITLSQKNLSAAQNFTFSFGDELLYIGYIDNLQSGILDAPADHETYTFQFATNITCPGTPTVEYEGQVYNTIQIFSQCWLKENLNVGIMITGSQSQTDNGTIEKYCYNNELDSCTKYGGLYQWSEMMQYTTQQGAQGICPPGWHLPTDEEWKVLEGSVDSQYGIGDNTWDNTGVNRGYDAGANLKTTSGWYENGNGIDLYDFSVLPVGRLEGDGSFKEMDNLGVIWASTEDSDLYSRFRAFSYLGHTTARGVWSKIYGHSVRCLRD